MSRTTGTSSPRLTLNLGIRFDGLPHAFERYNQFANFVPADYNASLGNPVTAAGTLDPRQLTPYNGTPFYLNGIRLAGVNGFPRGNVQNKYNTWQPRIGFAYDAHRQMERRSSAAALECSLSVFRATMYITLP